MADRVLEIKVKTESMDFKGDLGEELKINIEDLNESYLDQPGKYAWWAVLSAQAISKANKIKSEMENLKEYINKTLMGELDLKVRERMERTGEKATEARVERAIYTHKDYKKHMEKLKRLRIEYAEANGEAAILEAAKDAMDQRKDMLISLGAQLRSEGNNADLSVKKEQVKEMLRKKKVLKDTE